MVKQIEKSPFHLQHQVDSMFANQPKQLAFRARSVDEFNSWKPLLQAKFRDLLGIAGRVPPANPRADLLQSVDRGSYVEEKYALDVGENVRAPMYLLVPKAPAPYKTVLGFHGHDPSIQPYIDYYGLGGGDGAAPAPAPMPAAVPAEAPKKGERGR